MNFLTSVRNFAGGTPACHTFYCIRQIFLSQVKLCRIVRHLSMSFRTSSFDEGEESGCYLPHPVCGQCAVVCLGMKVKKSYTIVCNS